tara:strand:- start:218 stop:505 length:288 start_codon:yes stop_codon:yes gene_type:complete
MSKKDPNKEDIYVLCSHDEFPLAPVYELPDGQNVLTDFNVFFAEEDNSLQILMYQNHGKDLLEEDRVDMGTGDEVFRIVVPFQLLKNVVTNAREQ